MNRLIPIALLATAIALHATAGDPPKGPRVHFGTPRIETPGQVHRKKCKQSGLQEACPRVRAARKRRHRAIKDLFAKHEIDYPPAQVLLRAFKHEDELELWVRPRGQNKFTHLKTYPICCKSGKLGPKRKLNDSQVPEGFYHIIKFEPWSTYLLSMQINYPNKSDKIRGHPRIPGKDIFIHGSCVSIGCIPIEDANIEELYVIALDTAIKRKTRILVHIFPTRLDEKGLKWLIEKFCKNPKLIKFWNELKAGFDRFEEDHTPNKFAIKKNGVYYFR